jgi:formate hydrogenlyase transcriptional activator
LAGSPTDRAGEDEQGRFEALLAALSTRFVNVRPEDLDAAIEDVQRQICLTVGVELSALWEVVDEAPGDLVLTHFYAAQADLPMPLRGMSAGQHFPWLREEMLAGRAVAVSDLAALPDAAALDRDNLRLFGVQSNLTMPLSVGGGAVVAALGFNTTRTTRDWPEALVQRLHLVGQVFANALARKRTDDALRESEARSRLAAEAAEAGLWTFDYRTRTFWVSDQTRKIFGYIPDEAVDIERLERSVHADDWPRVAKAIEDAGRSGEGVTVEYRVCLPGGGIRWLSSRGRLHATAAGETRRLMGVSIDITDRKITDDRMAASRRFEALLLQVSTALINVRPEEMDRALEDALRRVCGILDLDLAVVWQWPPEIPGQITPTHAHPPLAELAAAGPLSQDGYPWVAAEMLAGRTIALSRLDDLPADAARDRDSATAAGIRSSLTLPLRTGSAPPLGAVAFNTLREERDWPDDLVARLQLIAQILASALARTRHERTILESEADSRATFEQAAVGIAHVATDGRWLRVNDRLCDIVGYSREELLERTFQDITVPDDLEADVQNVRRVVTGEIPTYSMEKRYIRKDGSIQWANLTVSLARTPGGEPRHFISVVEDIGSRKRAEEALLAHEARLATATDLAGLAFYEIDYGGGFLFADDRFRSLSGVDAEHGDGLGPFEFWLAHLHPDDRPHILQERDRLHEGSIDRISMEYRYLHPERGQVWLQHVARVGVRDEAGRAVKTFGVFRDVTTRRQAEEALHQSYVEIERLKDRLQAESDYLKAEIGVTDTDSGITGGSPAIKQVLHLVSHVAPTRSSVLVLGETGTGKELLARAIHLNSPRRGRVMIKVNCAAMPSGLVESELFGREKGAFTGALARQVGRFEIADGSTLFLDEVGELSLEVQAKLLRVLEEGEFERLGSPRTIKVDVRVIAATNRDLAEQIHLGRFREDLYYRLNVFPIRMPALRERAEDIPQLVWALLDACCSRMGKKITRVPKPTMEALQHLPWPGNVRELRNVIEYGAIISTGDTLEVRIPSAPGVSESAQTLVELEKDHILRTLKATQGRIKGPGGAATVLGMNPATLYSRMKKLGIR